MAAAVKSFWPNAKNAIGPAIEDGFYQDFDLGDVKISDDDLKKVEEKMRQILKTWGSFEVKEVSVAQARKDFADNPYKLELIDELAKQGKEITENDPGNFLDLCKGGHAEDPQKELQHFKLLSIAGAYWRGDEKNAMLTRIYGTAFPTKEELDHFLWQQEEAKKRDHKKLGRDLDLFLFSPSVGPGLPLLMPKGFILRRTIEEYLTKLKENNGLQFVWSPHIARSELYKQSHHWQKYDAMMPPLVIEEDEYTLKPMNCPHHFQIYLAKPKSYRDLPLRLAENATVYRYERSGVVNGLFRVRAVTQDDSHWFIPHHLLDAEIDKALDLTQKIYQDFGIEKYYARISTRDPKTPDKYLGKESVWKKAEEELVRSVKKRGISYEVGIGEAAFYGPKIDIMVEDSLGREWQLTTIQLDFNQPENFNLEYTDSDGSKKKVAVLHIAFLGSLERFIAILIEHYEGAFPLWISPIHVVIIPIADRHAKHAFSIVEILKNESIRVQLDERKESMQAKIRDGSLQKVPYIGIIGDKEMADKNVLSLRSRKGEDLGQISLSSFISKLQDEIASKK